MTDYEEIVRLRAALTTAQARIEALEARELALRRAITDYRAGIMALNPALSAALVAHLPEPQGGDSEF